MYQVKIRWCHLYGDGFDLNIERLDIEDIQRVLFYSTKGWICCSINHELTTCENTMIDGRSKRTFPCVSCSNKKCKPKIFTIKTKPVLLFSEETL